ncbi:PhzF family phenazine biosynthesis protein [Bradyrhizobium sp. 2TAF24]|uniref:PhzF family phenazine biosynthesis protein n=1 Tax=Bradyrhizobium sp. 2TAF24 TaxID=3233011 RepID=UPI003F8DA298
MDLGFTTVDVFTTTQFGGNPLAVVLNAEGLSTEQMQAIAAEFNLSETAFVRPPRDGAHTAEVRIFTPRFEMPFAGHPNVGTAFVLGRAGEACGRPISGDRLVFEEQAGLVAIDLIRDGTDVIGARVAAPQPLTVGKRIAPDVVAAACGLPSDAIALDHHTPCIASCGALFIMAEVKDRSVLAAATPRTELFSRHFAAESTNSILLYTRAAEGHVDIRCRMFAPLHGIAEDPATGSANVALVGLLAQLRPESDLTLDLTILQGVEMGRPSRLEARAVKRSGDVVETSIGGHCVPVMSGVLTLR